MNLYQAYAYVEDSDIYDHFVAETPEEACEMFLAEFRAGDANTPPGWQDTIDIAISDCGALPLPEVKGRLPCNLVFERPGVMPEPEPSLDTKALMERLRKTTTPREPSEKGESE